MIDRQEFLSRLVPIFLPKLASGDEDYCLIQAPFDQDRPDSPYATIQVISVEEIGHLDEGLVTDLGQELKQDADVTIRINTFGKGAIQVASRLKSCLEFPSIVDKMHQVNCYWRGDSQVTDLTALVKTKHQERASFEVILGTSYELIDEDIVPIHHVNLSLTTVENEDTTDIQNFTVNASYTD